MEGATAFQGLRLIVAACARSTRHVYVDAAAALAPAAKDAMEEDMPDFAYERSECGRSRRQEGHGCAG
jgi:hypothetical protein